MPVKAYLFDAQGMDHEVRLAEVAEENISENQILWIDATDISEQDLSQVGASLEIESKVLTIASRNLDRPRIVTMGKYVNITLVAPLVDGHHIKALPISLITGPNYLITLHSGAVSFLEKFDEQTRGDTQLGELDSGTFLVALLDRFLNSYFEVLDTLGVKVDRLDENALKSRRGGNLLSDIVQFRLPHGHYHERRSIRDTIGERYAKARNGRTVASLPLPGWGRKLVGRQ